MDQALSQKAGVYEIRNLVNGRRYVGSTIRLGQRRREHFKMLRAGSHKNPPLQAAWAKYGEASFEFRVLAVLEQDEVQPTEQRMLNAARAAGEPIYNVAVDVTSGMKGRHHGPRAKAIISATLNRYFSDPANRELHSRIKSSHAADPEVRQRMSDAQKAHFSDPAARAANAQRQRQVKGAPQSRQQHREISLAVHAARPELAVEHSERLRQHYSDPAARSAASARMRAFYATPAGQDSLRRMAESKRRKANGGA